MSDALIQRPRTLATPAAEPKPRALPLGYGLLVGAGASLGLWAGIFWLVGRAFV